MFLARSDCGWSSPVRGLHPCTITDKNSVKAVQNEDVNSPVVEKTIADYKTMVVANNPTPLVSVAISILPGSSSLGTTVNPLLALDVGL